MVRHAHHERKSEPSREDIQVDESAASNGIVSPRREFENAGRNHNVKVNMAGCGVHTEERISPVRPELVEGRTYARRRYPGGGLAPGVGPK